MVLVKKLIAFSVLFATFLTVTYARRHQKWLSSSINDIVEATLAAVNVPLVNAADSESAIDEDYYFGGRSYLRQSEGEEYLDEDNLVDAKILYYRPSIRHHIAHFCPNLEVARTCIWGCMKLGRPAFCGKDHICYCGHKYHPHQGKDPKQNNMTNFQDLYEKYFGPNTNLKDEVITAKPKHKKGHGTEPLDGSGEDSRPDDITKETMF